MTGRAVSKSKLLSFVLRHDPGSFGLTLARDGWVEVDDLLRALAAHERPLTRAELEQIVRESDKQRFALSADGARIRANQGHSVDVELGYEPAPPPPLLFHGTVEKFLAAILREGLKRGERHHVHLSATPELALSVGARRGRPRLLEIDAAGMALAGHEFFCTPNGVWLTSHVPANFLHLSS